MTVAEPVDDASKLSRGAKTLANHGEKHGWRWFATQNDTSTVVKLQRLEKRAVAYWSGKEKLTLVGCWLWTAGDNPARISMTDLKTAIRG